jgi:hypothetical protein
MSAFGGKADITRSITSAFCFCGQQTRCQRFANETRELARTDTIVLRPFHPNLGVFPGERDSLIAVWLGVQALSTDSTAIMLDS